MTVKSINFARYILESMSKISSIKRPTPLPYTNLLTLVFNHFSVCLDHELEETKSVPIITPASLKHIQLFKTSTGTWKFVEDMNPEEITCVSQKHGPNIKSRLTSPQSTPPPSLLENMMTLNEQIYELQETVDKLEYILVQHTDVLDGIAHNQAIMDNRLNRIQTLVTTHISEVHQKLGDLITMESMTLQCALKVVPLSAAEQAQSSAYTAQLLSIAKASKNKT